MRATDKAGRVHELRGDLLRVAGVPHRIGERRTIVNEGLARWTYEGRTGFGIAEYLHQLDERRSTARRHRVVRAGYRFGRSCRPVSWD